MNLPSGYWTIDVPIGPEIVDADMPVLKQLMADWPEAVSVREMQVVVNGRIWRWESVAIDKVFGNRDFLSPASIVDARARSTRHHDL